MKQIFNKIILAAIALCVAPLFPADKITLAIMPLHPQSEEVKNLAATVTTILRNELGATQRFTIVDLDSLSTLMQEQARQQAGLTDSATAVKLGNMLNVQKMVLGSVSKLGGYYEIRVNMTDVELGAIEISRDARTKKESQIAGEVEKLSKVIAAKVGLQGKILSVEGDGKFIVNIGSSDGVVRSAQMDVIRMGEPIVDKETGQQYGRKQTRLGKVRIVEFQGPTLAIVTWVKQPEKGKEFAAGDRVVIEGKEIATADLDKKGEYMPGTGDFKKRRKNHRLAFIIDGKEKSRKATIDIGKKNGAKKKLIYALNYKTKKVARAEIKKITDEEEAQVKLSKPLKSEYIENPDYTLRHIGKRRPLSVLGQGGVLSSGGGGSLTVALTTPFILGAQINLGGYGGYRMPFFVTATFLGCMKHQPYIGVGSSITDGGLLFTAGIRLFKIKLVGFDIAVLSTPGGVGGVVGIGLNL